MPNVMRNIVTYLSSNFPVVENVASDQSTPPVTMPEPQGFLAALWSYMILLSDHFGLVFERSKHFIGGFFYASSPTLIIFLATLCLIVAAFWHQSKIYRCTLAEIRSYYTDVSSLSGRAANIGSLMDQLICKMQEQQTSGSSVSVPSPASLPLSDDLRQHLCTLIESIKNNIGSCVESMPTATQFKHSMKISIVRAVQDEIKASVEKILDAKMKTQAINSIQSGANAPVLAEIKAMLKTMSAAYTENNKNIETMFKGLQTDILQRENGNAEPKKEVPYIMSQLVQCEPVRKELQKNSDNKILQLEVEIKNLEQVAEEQKDIIHIRNSSLETQKLELSQQLDLEKSNSAYLAEQLNNSVAEVHDSEASYQKLIHEIETLQVENAAIRNGMSSGSSASHGPSPRGLSPKLNGSGRFNGNHAPPSQIPSQKPNGTGPSGSRFEYGI